MSLIVAYDQLFNPNKLVASSPEAIAFKKGNDNISYHDINLHHNYGTESEPVISDVLIELPEVSAQGIRMKEEDASGKNGPYKKKVYSMIFRFDITSANSTVKADAQAAIDKHNGVYTGCCKIVEDNKKVLKKPNFSAANCGDLFKDPMYWPCDKVTQERIVGKNPSMFVKLKKTQNSSTLFTDMNNKPIDWSLLTDVELRIVPLLHYKKIYVGANLIRMKIFLISAVVTKIAAAGTESKQVSTVERLKNKYSNLADEVESQLAELRMARQETLSQQTGKEFGSSDYGTMHSNVGVGGSGNGNGSGESGVGGMGGVGSGSSGNEQASLQDFLSGAPTMSSATSAPIPQVPQTLKLSVQPIVKIN